MDAAKRKRLNWYLKKNAVILLAIFLLLVLTFFVAMNSANVYIVVTEGMEARAAVVLNDGDTGELSYYFTDRFLEEDTLLKSGKYSDYMVSRYTYLTTPRLALCWPLQAAVTMSVAEWVGNVDGELSQAKQDEVDSSAALEPPAWNNGEYAVSLVKQDGKWKIDNITLVRLVADPS